MGFIQDSDRPSIKMALDTMRSEVTLSYFTQEIECDFCRETHELLEELCSIEDKIKLRIYDFKGNPEEVFYAINGLRYVIGAFETALSSPTIRRPVLTEVLPGAWT